MAIVYADNEIATLIEERKLLVDDWRARLLRLQPKRGHREGALELAGDAGNEFRVILRQNTINPLDFSVILAVRVPQSNRLFRLRRYNGKAHQHKNHIENQTFYDIHIHMATERYQELGTREDAYAEVTNRYGDCHGAVNCLISDANFITPVNNQMDLF